MLCFDFANLDETAFIRALGKAADVRDAKLFLVSKAGCSTYLSGALEGVEVFEIVLFEDVEDLLERVGSIVTRGKEASG